MRERGQTIPFWTFAAIAMLAMMLTVWNYGAQVYWNIRAQTAADSAAAAGLSVQANIWNEESTILYAAAVDEYRLRALNQGILNTLNQNGTCNATTSTDPLYCGTIYTILVSAYNQAAKNYGADVQLLAQANQFTQGGQGKHKVDAQTLLGTCTNGASSGPKTNAVDAAFCYTVVGGTGGNGQQDPLVPHTIAVTACRQVPYFGSLLAGVAGGSFKAVASSGSALATGNAQSATVGNYQGPVEKTWYGQTPVLAGTNAQLQMYDVDFSNLTVNVNWYTATPLKTKLVTGFPPSPYDCLTP
jgi:Putative Flp pilus-assembly TadE/G-like